MSALLYYILFRDSGTQSRNLGSFFTILYGVDAKYTAYRILNLLKLIVLSIYCAEHFVRGDLIPAESLSHVQRVNISVGVSRLLRAVLQRVRLSIIDRMVATCPIIMIR